MELTERYIEEIRTYLPKDVRDDVSAELRSNLEESIEGRLEESPGLSREQIEIEVLKELGPPHELADSYVPRPRVLFGPRLYPAFLRTMKIAIGALVALAALGLAVEFSSNMSLLALGSSLISAFTSVLTGSLLILGIAVVVFSMIERSAVLPPMAKEEWDPGKLPAVEDPDKVSLGDRVASIAFLVVALVVVNFLRDWLGARVTINDESGWVPFLGPAFSAQLWLLNICFVLDLLVNFLVLLRWRWTLPLRWANFAVNCLYLTWLGRIAFGPSILAVDPVWMAEHGWSPEAVARYDELFSGLSRVFNINIKFGFYAACVGLAYSFFKLIRRMVTGR